MTCQPATLEIRKFDGPKPSRKRRIRRTIRSITTTVAEHFDTTPEHIMTKRRFISMVYPRQVICYLAYRYSSMNHHEISRFFGNKDHTFSITNRKACMNRMEVEPEFRERVEAIISDL